MEHHPDRLRFSGPELTELLDRVMAEHGETAAISAVNRVRSGGVAGFFCREEFEVVVDSVTAGADGADRADGTEGAEGGIEPGSADEAVAPGRADDPDDGDAMGGAMIPVTLAMRDLRRTSLVDGDRPRRPAGAVDEADRDRRPRRPIEPSAGSAGLPERRDPGAGCGVRWPEAPGAATGSATGS